MGQATRQPGNEAAGAAAEAKARVSDGLLHRVADELRRALIGARGPLTATELALLNEVGGSRESARRTVRFAVDHLRKRRGYRICASQDGYWIARDDAEWADYLESRKTGAAFEFVSVAKMCDAARDACNGQRRLRFGEEGGK